MRVLYVLQALGKGFSVYFFILLPIFFAKGFIDAAWVGYTGTLFIVCLILGALIVAKVLHNVQTTKLLQIGGVLAAIAALLLYLAVKLNSFHILLFSYSLMGLATGCIMSGLNALAAQLTTKGNRYKDLAKLGILSDFVRILFPLVVVMAMNVGDFSLAVLLIVFLGLVFLGLVSSVPNYAPVQTQNLPNSIGLLKNREFLKIVFVEFLDSLSSSQLFVFLPILFLSKNITLQNSLLLQSFIFVGYISGRWMVGVMAKRYSGYKAIGLAEIGMVLTIFLLLIINNLPVLYLLSFCLGVFARGTSPAIKALALDSLTHNQVKKGSAIHVVAGDSGSAFGQLMFGLLIGWFSVTVPFVVAAVVGVLVATICLINTISTKQFQVGR